MSCRFYQIYIVSKGKAWEEFSSKMQSSAIRLTDGKLFHLYIVNTFDFIKLFIH